jgi:hypothetical protein
MLLIDDIIDQKTHSMFFLDNNPNRNEQNEPPEPAQTLDELLAEFETEEESALNNQNNQNEISSTLDFLNTDTNILSNPFDPQKCTYHTFNLYEEIVDHEPMTAVNFERPTIKFMIHHDTQPYSTLWMRVHTLYDTDMDPFIIDPYLEEEFPLHILQLFAEYATDGQFCFLEQTYNESCLTANTDGTPTNQHVRTYWIKLPDNSLPPHIYNAINYYSSRALNNNSTETFPHYIIHHINHKMKQIPTLYQFIKEMWFNQFPYPE